MDCPTHSVIFSVCCQVDSSRESAEAACDILSQLVNCSLKTLGLISTARPSFMELPKVSLSKSVVSVRLHLKEQSLEATIFFFFSPHGYLAPQGGGTSFAEPLK